MRENLAPLNGQKSVFYGTVRRFGWRKFQGRYVGKTLLLVEVKDKNGKLLTDHVWFHLTKGLDHAELKPGDKVRFEARVGTYRRGPRDWDEFDYKFEYPNKIVKVEDIDGISRERSQAGLFD